MQYAMGFFNFSSLPSALVAGSDFLGRPVGGVAACPSPSFEYRFDVVERGPYGEGCNMLSPGVEEADSGGGLAGH